jgi:hypothetical protein
MTVAGFITIAILVTTDVTVHRSIIIVYWKKCIERVLPMCVSNVSVASAVAILVTTVVLIHIDVIMDMCGLFLELLSAL